MSEPHVSCRILLVEDEPLVLMDLEIAAEDAGCIVSSARDVEAALLLARNERLCAAVLDVNLGRGKTCRPVADVLRQRGIHFILHSGELDRQHELVRSLGALLVPKPSRAPDVIARAVAGAIH